MQAIFMSSGVPGIIAVGSNIAHKFGKAMAGSWRHGELGCVLALVAVSLLRDALGAKGEQRRISHQLMEVRVAA